MGQMEFAVVLLALPVVLKREALHHALSSILQTNTRPRRVAILIYLLTKHPIGSISSNDVVEKRDWNNPTLGFKLNRRPSETREKQNPSRNSKFLQEVTRRIENDIRINSFHERLLVTVSHLYQIRALLSTKYPFLTLFFFTGIIKQTNLV